MNKYYEKLKKSVVTRGIRGTIKEVWEQTVSAELKNRKLNMDFDQTSLVYGLNKDEREKEIIVALTTLPARIEKSIFVIDTLLKQTMQPDLVILYLGEAEFRDKELPREFTNLQKRGLTVKFVDDIGPHTKYFYAMQDFPNAIIITVDDDRIYERTIIEKLYESYLQFPQCISANWVKRIVFQDKKVLPHEAWPRVVEEGIPSKLNFALGVDGVLYPPNLLPEETYTAQKIRKLSLYADDVWLKGMELLNDIPVVKTPNSGGKVNVNITGTQQNALHIDNEGNDKNSMYINNVFGEYNLFKKLED